MKRKTADFILIAVIITLAVLLYYSTASYPPFAQKTTAHYVRFLALSLGILTVVQLILSAKANDERANSILKWTDNPARFWGLFVIIFCYALLLSNIGFFSASLIFLPVTMLMLGHRHVIQISLTTILTLGFVYTVFVRLLGVHLPKGAFF